MQGYYKHVWWIYTCSCTTIIHNITNLFLTSYGGPDTQKVTYKFQLGWEEFLVSSKNYIVAYADGRGGTGRGQNWLHANYKNLGTHEVEDAITAGRLIFWNPLIPLEGYAVFLLWYNCKVNLLKFCNTFPFILGEDYHNLMKHCKFFSFDTTGWLTWKFAIYFF